jgi:hypothetical protein
MARLICGALKILLNWVEKTSVLGVASQGQGTRLGTEERP